MKRGHRDKEHEFALVVPKCCSNDEDGNAPMEAIMHDSGLLSLVCYACGKPVFEVQTVEGTVQRLRAGAVSRRADKNEPLGTP